MESWSLRVFCLLCLALLDAVHSLDKCTIDASNKCKCKAPNNKTLDISNYFKYPVNVQSDDPTKYTYKFSPCTPMVCEPDVDVGTVCQYIISQDRWTVLGRQTSDMTWFINDYDPLYFTVNFFDGDPDPDGTARQAKMRFTYSKTDPPTIAFSEELPDVTYEFAATGKVVAFVSQNSGGGGGGGGGTEAGVIGWVIIALAIVGVITYFVVGGIYMYQAKEARGLDIIPNLAFWKDLPFLIKDGFVFTFGPCVNMIRGRLGYEKM